MKSLTSHFFLIIGLLLMGPYMAHANSEPGYTSMAGEIEATGPEKKLCSHCEASCSVSDSGVDRGDQSCEALRKRADLLANGGSSPASRSSGKDDSTN